MLGMLETPSEKPSMYSPLTLAYIGDSVYEVYVRANLLKNGNLPTNRLHKESIKFVSAESQSGFMEKLEPLLTQEEDAVYKRGRNAKSYTVPKHARLIDYKRATGFEALIGYLYLSKNQERIDELMKIIFNIKK